MKPIFQTSLLVTALMCAVACGGASDPGVSKRMADVQGADRTATELGAQNTPRAALHLKLAREQTELAKKASQDGEDERAAALLDRARADAELAISLRRQDQARQQTERR